MKLGKLVEKPPIFDSDEKQWTEWKFTFLSWLYTQEERFRVILENAEMERGPIPPQDQDHELHGLQVGLYAILTSYLRGKALALIRAVENRNGYEAWRVITEEFDGRSGNRRLIQLSELMMPVFRHESYVEDMLRWETACRDYEVSTGHAFGNDLRVAVVLRTVPPRLQQRLTLNIAVIGDDYQKVRTLVMTFFRLEREMADDIVKPMEVNALQAWQGGRTSKGGGKGKSGGGHKVQGTERERRARLEQGVYLDVGSLVTLSAIAR